MPRVTSDAPRDGAGAPRHNRFYKPCGSCGTDVHTRRRKCGTCQVTQDTSNAKEVVVALPARAVGLSRTGHGSHGAKKTRAHGPPHDDDDENMAAVLPDTDDFPEACSVGYGYGHNVKLKGLAAVRLASNVSKTSCIYAAPTLSGIAQTGSHEHVLVIHLGGGKVWMDCTCTESYTSAVVSTTAWGAVDEYDEGTCVASCAKCEHAKLVHDAVVQEGIEASPCQEGKLSLRVGDWVADTDCVVNAHDDAFWLIHQPSASVHSPPSISSNLFGQDIWPRACVTSARVVNRSREQEVFSCCSRACETNKLKCAHVRRVATAVDDALASMDESTVDSPMYAALLFSEVCTKETLDCIHATTTTGSSTSVSTQVLSRDSPWEGSVARMEGCNSGGGIIVPCTQYSCAELGKRCDHVMDAKPEYAPTCCESHEWKCTFVDDALLLHETCVSTVLVHEWVCSCGKEKVAFDGKSSGMFNWSNKTLATHELCWDFYDNFVLDGRTFTAHWRAQKMKMEKLGFVFVGRNTYREIMKAFMELVTCDWKAAMSCPCCSSGDGPPRVVILDGVTLGSLFRTLPQADDGDQVYPPQKARSASNKYVLSSTSARKLIRASRMSGRNLAYRFSADEVSKLEEHMRVEMTCEDGDPDTFVSKVIEANSESEGNSVVVTGDAARFLFNISTTSPAVALVAYRFACKLLGSIEKSGTGIIDLEDVVEMKNIAPILYTWLTTLVDYTCGRPLEPAARKFFTHVCTRAILQDSGSDERTCHESTAADALTFHGAGLPRRRVMQRRRAKDCDEGDACTKKQHRHRLLSPGVFLVVCPHGVVLLYAFMTEAEGTHTPMRILYERWKEPPDVVIYDNSCNLHRSCVIHEGRAFKNTEFFHDRLHQWNHTSCCDGYDMSKQDVDRVVSITDTETMPLRFVNTQGAEQCNSRLAKIRTMLAYSTFSTASITLKHFIKNYNDSIRTRMTRMKK